jgi:transposase
VQLLDTLPEVNQRIARIMVAEIGVDMRRFSSAAHLASWVGLYPGKHHRAGKPLPGTTRKGDRWLRQALIEAAGGELCALKACICVPKENDSPDDGAKSGQ